MLPNHEEGERVDELVEVVEGVEDLGEICTLSQEVVVTMSWNDFKFMMIEEFCPSHEMQKLETELWNHAVVRAGHAAYTDRFHELARLVPHLVTLESKKIDRNGSIKKVEKRGNVGEPIKDKNGKDDNKRTRTGNAFATTANPVGRENTCAWPKCTTCNSDYVPGGPHRTCFNCNRPGHLEKDCRGMPRNVNPVNARNPTVKACYECGSTDHVRLACPRLNRAQGPGGNLPNQVVANNRGQVMETKGTKPGKTTSKLESIRIIVQISNEVSISQSWGINDPVITYRAFILRAKEVRKDPNIMTGLPPLQEIEFQIELIPRAVPVAKSPIVWQLLN
nr:reverse transcriptase domain-containing protein [Tanacetum cinerariifolium]